MIGWISKWEIFHANQMVKIDHVFTNTFQNKVSQKIIASRWRHGRMAYVREFRSQVVRSWKFITDLLRSQVVLKMMFLFYKAIISTYKSPILSQGNE